MENTFPRENTLQAHIDGTDFQHTRMPGRCNLKQHKRTQSQASSWNFWCVCWPKTNWLPSTLLSVFLSAFYRPNVSEREGESAASSTSTDTITSCSTLSPSNTWFPAGKCAGGGKCALTYTLVHCDHRRTQRPVKNSKNNKIIKIICWWVFMCVLLWELAHNPLRHPSKSDLWNTYELSAFSLLLLTKFTFRINKLVLF